MPKTISFGTWLRQQRRTLDLTQKALADQVGCAEITVRRMEADEYKPSSELANVLFEKLGISESERTQWVRFARGLTEFPDHQNEPVTIPGQNTNLPLSLTSFIGREKEQDEVINLIKKNRLVTLAGVGGIGKTRLSQQVGQKLLNDYPDGVWFIALDSLSNPNLVPQTVAAVFDIREGPDRPVIEILTNVLRSKSTLLILDNCEHLLDACIELINTLLTNCPNLKILATSRETLKLAGEAVYATPSLSLPELDNTSLESLTEYESVKLFTDRAMLAASSFTLTKDNAQTVVAVCKKVDGIPLAIELAAACVNILQVKEILKQLEDSFSLLASADRKTLPRHQTLRASMDWSWGMLSEAEQVFMYQLSVFSGGWTLESAQAVCDGDILSLTSSLVKKSLIMVDQETRRETRYRFHEMICQYAREKLIEAGEEENIRTQHLKYFLGFSEQAESGLKGFEQIAWMERLHVERDNIRAALGWAAKTDVEAGLYISGRLNIFWEMFDMREGVRWLEVFIQNRESKSYPRARAKALLAQGYFLNLFERFAESLAAAQECLDFYRSCSDIQGEIDGLLISVNGIENGSQGMELMQHALSLAQSINDKWRQARVLSVLGWAALENRQYPYLKEALKLFKEEGDLGGMTGVMAELGRMELLNGDLELARKSLDEAVSVIRQLNFRGLLADVLQEYGRIESIKGNYEQAYASLQESADIFEEQGARLGYLYTRAHLGTLAFYQGEINQARAIFGETAREFFFDKFEGGVMFTLEGMAGVYVALDKRKIAAQWIGYADITRQKNNDTRPPIEQADVDKIITACVAKLGEAAYSDAYDEGQKMTMDEAVALALKES